MDVQWMQNFLGVLHCCDAQPPSSNGSINTSWFHDLEGEDDMCFQFSCPFCYLEFDIGSLCSHIEEEHSFEFKSAVCPVCAVRVGSDVIGHISQQHGNLFRMQRRRSLRSASSVSVKEADRKSTINLEQHITSLELPWECGPKLEVAHLQAKFVQQLVLSTFFGDD